MILLIPIAFSRLSPNTVQAQSLGNGNFTGTSTCVGETTLPNGTIINHCTDKIVLHGVFIGNSTAAETDLSPPNMGGAGTFHIVETFAGFFNGSKQGTITFLDNGIFDAYGDFSEKDTFSAGTGGLAGLQGTMTARGAPTGSGNSYSGSYTVTSAIWGDPKAVPEFSDIALPTVLSVLMAVVCFTMFGRKKANLH